MWLSAPPPGAALTITVTAADLPSLLLSADANHTDALLPQRWAVAVVGHFSGTLASELNPAYVRQGQLGLLQVRGGAQAACWLVCVGCWAWDVPPLLVPCLLQCLCGASYEPCV